MSEDHQSTGRLSALVAALLLICGLLLYLLPRTALAESGRLTLALAAVASAWFLPRWGTLHQRIYAHLTLLILVSAVLIVRHETAGDLLMMLAVVLLLLRAVARPPGDLTRPATAGPAASLGQPGASTGGPAASTGVPESEPWLRHIFDDAPVCVGLTAPNGRILQVNRAMCEWVGYTEAELLTMGMQAISHPDDVDLNLRLRAQTLSGGLESYHMAKRYLHKNGQVLWGMLHGSLVRAADGKPQYFIAMIRDITEQRMAQEALRESEERFRSVFEYAAVGMIICHPPDFRIIQVNQAFARMLGYTESELLGMNFRELYFVDAQQYSPQLKRVLAGEIQSYQVEREYRHRQGHSVWGSITVSAVRFGGGSPQYLVVQTQDITERRQVEAQLLHAANHDPLTDLYNRRHFAKELELRLAEARRYGTPGALLFLDLDHFKEVNDCLGHAAGDELLRRVAEHLRREMRETDILGRFGGDEFAILLTNTGAEHAAACAERILRSIPLCALTVPVPGSRMSTSIGIALVPDHEITVDQLLARADAALYQAKREGRNGYRVFAPETASAEAAPAAAASAGKST